MRTQDAVSRANGIRVGPESFSQTGLLQTKLYKPHPRPNTISRERLIERLNSNGDVRLVLISAPAGFGKSTLAAEWLGSTREPGGSNPVAWVSLEEADNDLGRFWRYVVGAFQTVDPTIGERLDAMLARPALPPAETWLGSLLNDLALLGRPFVLVLDDYHVIHTRSIHQSLNYLLQHLPAGMRLVLIARADPPLPLARLRVQDELVELRAADLRFDTEEIEHYLNAVLELGLSPDDLDRLESRTEGWPAGVHLAARSLQGHELAARRDFIHSFSGSNHFVLNYLLEEVLQQQQPAVRDFLLRTALLSRLSGPLCAAVTDQPVPTAAHILTRLAHDHLFVIPLDDAGHWFRYHSLFAEALETRLRENDSSLWNEIHRKASQWCATNGHTERAIVHALACRDHDTAAALIEEVGDKTWSTGDIAAPLRWLDALPRAIIGQRMALRLLYIWILFLHDRWGEAQALWEETGRLLDTETGQDDGACRGRWAAIGAAMGAHRLLPEETVRLTQQALSLLPSTDHIWRVVSQINLGLAYQAQGNAGPAATNYRAMADVCIAQGNLYLAFAALAHLTEVCHMQGHLYEAQATCERLQELESTPGGRTLALRANANIGFGRLAYERNDLLTAERLLDDAVGRIWPGGQPRMVLVARTVLSRIHELRGERAAARRELNALLEMVTGLSMSAEEKSVRALLARLALHEGRWDDVLTWQETAVLSAQDLPDFRREFEHVVLVDVLIGSGHLGEAEALLARLRSAAERSGRAGSHMALSLRYAVVLAQQKRLQEADSVMRHVLPPRQ